MSYPLVQFASDTVTKTSARALRINLISLLLSGLADVVIFGEVEAIIELFHHHKVLYKCLDLARDVQSSADLVNEIKLHVVASLMRAFRVTLEKHTRLCGAVGAGASAAGVDTHRSLREDLVKHVCGWFTNGLAQMVTACITDVSLLQSCPDALITALLSEIGQVVRAVGLCQFHGSKRADETSYHYLKETRSSLANLFLGVINKAPEMAENLSEAIVHSLVVDCLSKSICAAPHLASTCALSLLKSASNTTNVLMEWLEQVIRHFYLRHNVMEHDATTFKSPDSDSAIDVECGLGSLNTERPKIQSLWTPYLEFFLKDHVDHLFKIVQDSLGRLIQVITVDGRVHLFSGVM